MIAAQTVPPYRRADWQARLAAAVARCQAQPFRWGVADCCMWAADAVGAVTDVDPAADLRGRYGNAKQAAALLARLGGLAGLCAQRLGPAVPPAQAQPGDVGLFREPGREGLAVQVGGVWLGQGAAGLVPVRPECVHQAWRCVSG